MKRKMVAVWMAAMMAAMLLSGCGEKETAESVVAEESSVSRVEVSAESSEPSVQEPIEAVTGVDQSTIQKITDYYNAQIPDDLSEMEVYCIYEYSDLYRGSFDWDAYGSCISLDYYAADWDYMEIGIDKKTGLAYLDVEISYDDSTAYEVYIEDVDVQTIGKALANPETISEEFIYADAALEGHDVYKDFKIMFARLQELADKSFAKVPGVGEATSIGLIPKVNVGAEPASLLSKELPFLVNEHHFENGQCTDCDINWYDYFLQGVLKLDSDSDEDYGIVYGMENECLLDVSDSIRFANRYGNGSIDYGRVIIYPDTAGYYSEDNTLSFNSEGRMSFTVVYVDYFLTQEGSDEEPDIFGHSQYCLQVDTDAEHLAEVLTSKEALMENSTFAITFFSIDDESYEFFDDWTEEDIASYLAKQNYTPASKEELCDELAKNSAGMLKAMDKSLIEFDTSLAEAGIHMDILGK